MTQDNIISENTPFDFESFRREAAEKIKAGQPLTGNGGILTPLIKEIMIPL